MGCADIPLLLLGHGDGGHVRGHSQGGALCCRRGEVDSGGCVVGRLRGGQGEEDAGGIVGLGVYCSICFGGWILFSGTSRGRLRENNCWSRQLQVIIDSQPLTVAILAALFFGESIGYIGAAGLVLGVVGLLLLEVPAIPVDGNSFSLWGSGEWWMLLAAQSMAIGTVMVRWVSTYSDSVMATGWHMIIGGIPLLAISVLDHDPGFAGNLNDLNPSDFAALFYTSVFGGAISYGVFFYNATRGSLTKLSSLTFLTPMFASVFGYLYLDETFSNVQLFGVFVTLVAIYLVNYRSSSQ